VYFRQVKVHLVHSQAGLQAQLWGEDEQGYP